MEISPGRIDFDFFPRHGRRYRAIIGGTLPWHDSSVVSVAEAQLCTVGHVSAVVALGIECDDRGGEF